MAACCDCCTKPPIYATWALICLNGIAGCSFYCSDPECDPACACGPDFSLSNCDMWNESFAGGDVTTAAAIFGAWQFAPDCHWLIDSVRMGCGGGNDGQALLFYDFATETWFLVIYVGLTLFPQVITYSASLASWTETTDVWNTMTLLSIDPGGDGVIYSTCTWPDTIQVKITETLVETVGTYGSYFAETCPS